DLAVVVDRDDVRVGELRRQRRLALEPAAVLLVGGQLPQEALQRDEPLTARVVGAVDLAHATAPDQGVEPVGPEDLRLHIGQTTGRATATDVASRQTTHTRPSRPAAIATGPAPTSTAGPTSRCAPSGDSANLPPPTPTDATTARLAASITVTCPSPATHTRRASATTDAGARSTGTVATAARVAVSITMTSSEPESAT